jgi:hypothetical protein
MMMRMTTTAIDNGQDNSSLLAPVDFGCVSTAVESPPTMRQYATKEAPNVEAGLATATRSLA